MSGVMPTIYHGTPITPRAALVDVCAGRAMCVSFWRLDDAEVVQAISPAIMFRQWRFFGMAGGAEARRGMVHSRGLAALFRVARASIVPSRKVGRHTRCAGRAVTAKRQPASAMAIRSVEGCASVAHGWASGSAAALVRAIRPRLPGMDRQGQVTRQSRLPRAHGGSCSRSGKQVASASHDARNSRGSYLSVHQRRQHQSGAEWSSL